MFEFFVGEDRLWTTADNFRDKGAIGCLTPSKGGTCHVHIKKEGEGIERRCWQIACLESLAKDDVERIVNVLLRGLESSAKLVVDGMEGDCDGSDLLA